MKYKKPAQHADEVLIQVKACGISLFDKRVISGDLREFVPATGILGYEVSGTIEHVGNAVQGYCVGDEVIAALPLDIGGGYAEYVAANSNCIGM